MNELKPMLFTCLKSYSKEKLIKDIIAGIIVAIIALPLSIALALASGVGPEEGIYTAIIAGFVISMLLLCAFLMTNTYAFKRFCICCVVLSENFILSRSLFVADKYTHFSF